MWVGALVLVAAGAAAGPRPAGADACQPCAESIVDPKMHGRSLKSYWGVASKTRPPDPEVLKKAYDQGHLALCGTPDQWEWNMFMGMVSAELGKFEQAGCYFTEALKYATDEKDRKRAGENRGHYWTEHYNEAINLCRSEAYDRAVEQFDIAIALDPSSCKTYQQKSAALINLRRFTEAVSVLERGLEVCPDDTTSKSTLFSAVHNQGITLLKEAEAAKEDSTRRRFYAEAASWFKRADQLDPEALDNVYNLGLVYFQLVSLGDSTHAGDARETFERFLVRAEKKEERANTLYQLTLLEIRAKDWDKADEYADRFIAADPHDPTAYQLKAVATTERGKAELSEAYIIFYNSLEKGKPVENLDAWLGQAKTRYGATGDVAKALKEKGTPEEVRSYTDSSGNDMDSFFYWSKGEAIAFYGGHKRGALAFPAQTP
jgi:tetratricopeptide (TPR) repeat protein